MVAALEDLIAQTAAEVCLTLEECTGELQREMKTSAHAETNGRSLPSDLCARRMLDLLYKEPEPGEDMPESGGGLIDLKEEQVGVQHLLHQCILSLIQQQLLLYRWMY